MRKYLQPYEAKALDEAVADLRKSPNSPGSSRFAGQGLVTVVHDGSGGVNWEISGRCPPGEKRLTGRVGRVVKAKA